MVASDAHETNDDGPLGIRRTEQYIAGRNHASRDDSRELDVYLSRLAQFVDLNTHRRLLEIGSGTGWFQVLGWQRGFRCRGVEYNQRLVQHSRETGRQHGVELNIIHGPVETVDMGAESCDLVFALSVFEHIPDFRAALDNIFRTLAPGGALYFYSTNKFAPRSGEYHYPFYGWMPTAMRRRIRVRHQGPDVVDSNQFDSHQFTYWGLRREFSRAGFSRVVDLFEMLDEENLSQPTSRKKLVAKALRRFPPARTVARLFAPGTTFICVK